MMKKLHKYTVITKVSLANALTYRSTTYLRFFFYTFFIYVFMSLWRAIYQQGSVHGYGYVQMVWYLIMTEFVSFACGSDIYSTMNDEVKSGSIAYHLGRPSHYVFYQLANSMGQVLLNMMGFGTLAIVIGFVFVGPLFTFTMAGLPPLILSVTLSILLNFFILMLLGLSSFVIEDNYAFYLIYQKATFMLGMFLPVEFLPSWLQKIARNLPFSYVHWAPAKIFVDYSNGLAIELISRQALCLLAAITATLLSYHLAIRRLQVNGG
ncbi:MAG: hypothetical protein FWG88_11455 [Oscillospiraceae bacterium]|nr:hypothetical protein [Oscillospiraceae bacterium]